MWLKTIFFENPFLLEFDLSYPSKLVFSGSRFFWSLLGFKRFHKFISSYKVVRRFYHVKKLFGCLTGSFKGYRKKGSVGLDLKNRVSP